MKKRYFFLSLGALSLSLVYGCGSSSTPANDSGLGGDTNGGSGGTGSNGTGSNGSGSNGSGSSSSGGSGTGGSTEPVTTKRLEGTDNYDCSAPTGTIPGLKLAPIVSGLDRPVLVTHAPNDDKRLFVVEQTGKIRLVTGLDGTPTLETTPFLNIANVVRVPTQSWEEFGFLGLAFHPNYAENGLFYVYYSSQAIDDIELQEGIVAEYKVSDGDPDVADATSARRVMKIEDPADNHNGGTITFGSDGMLYIAIGDGGGANNEFGNGQSLDDLLGGVLRIDVDGRGAGQYGIPTGNLKDEVSTAAPEIWDYGLRNPYRMNFDGCTGYLYIGDVGQGAWEEIDIELANSGHKNYGWSVMEGTHCFDDDTESCDKKGLTLPFTDFENTGGSAVVGGTVYRGTKVPSLRGTYFYSDAGAGRFWMAKFDGETLSTPVSLTDDLDTAGEHIHSIQNGGDGEVYLTLQSGELMRIEAD